MRGDDLTERELGIMIRIADGMTIEAIAVEMELSPHTITSYRRSAFDKLGAHSAAEAVACCYHLGIFRARVEVA